jgi:hypothetical protein
MPLRTHRFLLLLAVLAAIVVLWLTPGTEHDLSQPVAEAAYPKLLSDDLPKKPVLPITGPFENGWSEPSPLGH